jgi:hypothetical protein
MKAFVVAVGVLAFATPVTFAKTKAKAKKPETYPATEEAPSEEVLSSAPGYAGIAAPNSIPEHTATGVALAPSRKTSKKAIREAAYTAATQSQSRPQPQLQNGFDVVPPSQTEPLIRRLHLAEQLVMRYGRAYDYRSMTVVELQTILNQLDTEAQKQSQARMLERNRAQALIRTEAEAANVNPAEMEAAHDSIGSEAPEAVTPPPPPAAGPGTSPVF